MSGVETSRSKISGRNVQVQYVRRRNDQVKLSERNFLVLKVRGGGNLQVRNISVRKVRFQKHQGTDAKPPGKKSPGAKHPGPSRHGPKRPGAKYPGPKRPGLIFFAAILV